MFLNFAVLFLVIDFEKITEVRIQVYDVPDLVVRAADGSNRTG